MTTQKRTASLKPSEMSEGGGLLNDVNLKWTNVGFVLWDYNGKSPTKSPALKVTLVDEDGETSEQYWSAGDAKNWVPSADGKRLQSVSSVEKQNISTNMGILIKSLVDSGFDESLIGDDVSIFEGLVAHMIQVPAPKRGGTVARAPRADGRTFEPTILVVDSIVTMPGEKKAGARRGAGTRAPASTKTSTASVSATSNGELDATAVATLKKILEDNLGAHPDGLLKAELPRLVFNELRADKELRNSVTTRVNDDDFLTGGGEGVWEYVDGKVSLA